MILKLIDYRKDSTLMISSTADDDWVVSNLYLEKV